MVTFELCDYNNPTHANWVKSLLNHYMLDPMGDADPITESQASLLFTRMSEQRGAFFLLTLVDGEPAGVVTCFELISTFKVQPYLYIHDVVVHSHFRGMGIGRASMERVVQIARERGCCKITLEVREDNAPALGLYTSLGFVDCDPKMYFWTKTL